MKFFQLIRDIRVFSCDSNKLVILLSFENNGPNRLQLKFIDKKLTIVNFKYILDTNRTFH